MYRVTACGLPLDRFLAPHHEQCADSNQRVSSKVIEHTAKIKGWCLCVHQPVE